jgi:hypothetical protein
VLEEPGAGITSPTLALAALDADGWVDADGSTD